MMKKLKDYIFELVVIFVGISLSFYVEEWREGRENVELLHSNLASIKLELIEDTVVLSEKLRHIDSANVRLNSCLVNQKYELKEGELFDSWIDIIATLNMIISHSQDLRNNNASFKNYTQNSFSQYLRNAKLKGLLNEYYEVKRIELLEDEVILKDISEKLREFVLSEVSFYKHTATIAKGQLIARQDLNDLSEDLTKLLKREEFLNYLSLKIERINIHKYGSGKSDKGDDSTYPNQIDFIKEIIAEIDKEVNQ